MKRKNDEEIIQLENISDVFSLASDVQYHQDPDLVSHEGEASVFTLNVLENQRPRSAAIIRQRLGLEPSSIVERPSLDHLGKKPLTKEDLRHRICSLIQVVIFVIAMIAIINILFLGYHEESNQDEEDLEQAEAAKECDFDAILGDGFCDDQANNYRCQFDHGDCCGDNVLYGQCLKCLCLVTTVATTLKSTTTTVTEKIEPDRCPTCLRKDYAFIPNVLKYPPVAVDSFQACEALCDWILPEWHYIPPVKFYNYYTSHYHTNLSNQASGMCACFSNYVDRIFMKNVISAGIDSSPMFG